MSTPLTDAINALTTYANETTGASDTDLSSAVATLVAGYGSGGSSDSQWVRPSDWPDLSQMDISAGDIIYMTSYADVARGFCDIYVTCTGSYTVEVGTISGSTFTAESTQTVASGTRCQLYYGSTDGTYKVLRVTGETITNFRLGDNANAITIGTFYGYAPNNGIIDVVGTLPYCTGMNHANCYNLINMQIDSVILSGSAASMFNNCTALTSLDVSGWDVSSMTNTTSMFKNCTALTSLDVSGWNVSSVTSMYTMFNNCTALTSLDVSGWDVSSVTNMYAMFNNCTALTSLDVSGWDVSSVTNTASMFKNCYGLHGSVTIPASITQIGTSCFADTRSLYEYHFLSTTPPTLSSTNAFTNMTDYGNKKIYVPSDSLETYQAASNWSTYASYMEGE